MRWRAEANGGRGLCRAERGGRAALHCGQNRRERPRNSEGRPAPGERCRRGPSVAQRRVGATGPQRRPALLQQGEQPGASISGTRGEAALGPAPTIGWVDTHLHLLPGLDDGPKDWEESLAMAEVLIADGTTHVVVTPHSNYQFTFSQPGTAALCRQLQEKLAGRLHIMTGCEVHLTFENVQALLERPREFSLNGSRYVLVEFPEFFERQALASALRQIADRGMVPVLAHPERNPVLQQHPETLDEYLRLGCLSQVTASSFRGRFGKRAEQFSLELLRGGRIHVVASDGHSAEQRSPRLSPAAAFITERTDEQIARALCSGNPLAMALDQPQLPYAPEAPQKKKSLFARLKSS
ncbi:MAG: tyrosine-protein phosphatase [Terriglobales bacterium]